MKKKSHKRKKIDIYQKSFAFTHRYNDEKFAFEKLKSIRNNFALKINNRLILAAVVFSSIYLAVAIRMIDVNLFYHQENKYFSNNELIERGNIYDRNDVSITANIKMYNIGINPNQVDDKSGLISKIKSIYPSINEVDLRKKFKKDKFFYLKRNTPPTDLQEIVDLGETGITIENTNQRKYLHKELFSHLIGKVDIDNEGISGIEKSFNAVLKSESKKKFETSLDVRLQHIVRDEILSGMDLYSATGGSGLIIDVNSGEILSMVSLPDFDPNAKTQNHDNMFNKNTLGLYEFGSVMKTFTTAIGIEEKKFFPNSMYEINDSIKIGKYRVRDVHRPCEEDYCSVEDIFVHSSNVGTIQMIRDVGKDLQQSYLYELGLLNEIDLELPELASPIYPDPWRMANTESISYGYGLSISPLHLASATAAVVNGGYLIKPTLRKKEGEEIKGERLFSEQTSEIMRYLMSKVVDQGTAARAFSEHTDYKYIVGGKTGTAKKIIDKSYDNKKMTTFISTFPINKPEYIVLVSLDEPKGINDDYHPYNTFGWTDAGWNSTRVVRHIIDRIGPILDTKTKYLPNENIIIKTSH